MYQLVQLSIYIGFIMVKYYLNNARNVKELFKLNNANISRISIATGVSRTSFDNWFSGKNSPRLDSVETIAAYLKMDFAYDKENGYYLYFKKDARPEGGNDNLNYETYMENSMPAEDKEETNDPDLPQGLNDLANDSFLMTSNKLTINELKFIYEETLKTNPDLKTAKLTKEKWLGNIKAYRYYIGTLKRHK